MGAKLTMGMSTVLFGKMAGDDGKSGKSSIYVNTDILRWRSLSIS